MTNIIFCSEDGDSSFLQNSGNINQTLYTVTFQKKIIFCIYCVYFIITLTDRNTLSAEKLTV
jgi:hypothetical protein